MEKDQLEKNKEQIKYVTKDLIDLIDPSIVTDLMNEVKKTVTCIKQIPNVKSNLNLRLDTIGYALSTTNKATLIWDQLIKISKADAPKSQTDMMDFLDEKTKQIEEENEKNK